MNTPPSSLIIIKLNNFKFSGLPSVPNMFMMHCLQPSKLHLFLFLVCVYLIATNTYIMSFLGYPSLPSSQFHGQALNPKRALEHDTHVIRSTKVKTDLLALSFFLLMFL